MFLSSIPYISNCCQLFSSIVLCKKRVKSAKFGLDILGDMPILPSQIRLIVVGKVVGLGSGNTAALKRGL